MDLVAYDEYAVLFADIGNCTELIFCPDPAAGIMGRTPDEEFDVIFDDLFLHVFQVNFEVTVNCLKLFHREYSSVAFYAASEGAVNRLEDHDVVIFLCEHADGVGDRQDDSRQLYDLRCFDIPVKSVLKPACNGVIVGLVRFRITVDPV